MLENYTNLSQTFLLTSLLASSAALGISFVIAWRFLPIFRQAGNRKSDGGKADGRQISQTEFDKYPGRAPNNTKQQPDKKWFHIFKQQITPDFNDYVKF